MNPLNCKSNLFYFFLEKIIYFWYKCLPPFQLSFKGKNYFYKKNNEYFYQKTKKIEKIDFQFWIFNNPFNQINLKILDCIDNQQLDSRSNMKSSLGVLKNITILPFIHSPIQQEGGEATSDTRKPH